MKHCPLSRITWVFISSACRAKLPYLDDVKWAVFKNWGLVILDWYFEGKMEKCSG